MGYRRKRGFKGTWLPAYGDEAVGSEDIQVVGFTDALFSINNGEAVNTNVFALLPDAPQEDYDTNQPLVDIIGSEYALRRIVGKFHASTAGSSGAPEQTLVKVGLGFFISTVSPVEPLLPIGAPGNVFTADTQEAAFDQYSPLALAAIRQPWIWRRTWILQALDGVSPQSFPASTAGYGSVLDGPHIDAKTRRRVRQDERLFGSVSISYMQPEFASEPAAGSQSITYNLDLRFFGALRKAQAKGAF